RNARNTLERFEGLFHGPIALGVTQDVTLAGPALFGGEDVADGYIAHVDPIQSCVEIRGHLTIEEIDNDFAGWGWFHVPRSYRSAWIYDHNRCAFGGELAGDLLRLPF